MVWPPAILMLSSRLPLEPAALTSARESRGRGGSGDLAFGVHRHAGNRAGGRMRNDVLNMGQPGAFFRGIENCGNLLVISLDRRFLNIFRAIDSRAPVERRGRFPRQPCEPGAFCEET